MAPTSALLGSTDDSTKQILNGIESQFQLSNDGLIEIVQKFLHDFALGLGEYNHPMAMMYVMHILATLFLAQSIITISAQPSSLVCLMARRLGESFVRLPPLRPPSMIAREQLKLCFIAL